MDWHSLVDQMTNGSIPALARLITLVENRADGWRDAMTQIYPMAGNAVTIGITGYPGSGKSTLAGRLVRELVSRGKRVGVVAVDPSSHLSGGAFLGDRVRMNELSSLAGVYIRSMGSRGAIGGIRPAVRDVIKILDAFGKNYVLVETVGVGQDEIDIARATQVVLLVCAPGQGDAIQYLKAGVMEIADIYVANKSDLPASEQLLNNLRGVLLQGDTENRVNVSIVQTDALKGVGIRTLVEEVGTRIRTSQLQDTRRRQMATEDLKSLLNERIAELTTLHWADEVESIERVDDILSGRTDPYSLADEILIKGLKHLLQQKEC